MGDADDAAFVNTANKSVTVAFPGITNLEQ